MPVPACLHQSQWVPCYAPDRLPELLFTHESVLTNTCGRRPAVAMRVEHMNHMLQPGGQHLTSDVSSRFRRKDYWKAKYELLHVVRTHMGANDQRYGCVYQREDSKGRVGVHLSKELMAIAGHALKANITTLGPLVLPISEQLIFFGNLVARKVCSECNTSGTQCKACLQPYKLLAMTTHTLQALTPHKLQKLGVLAMFLHGRYPMQ